MNASVKVKLCNSLLAFVLVVGLCIPTFGVDAYAEPENELQGTPITESFENETNQSTNEIPGQLGTETPNQETSSSDDQLNKQTDPGSNDQIQTEATTLADELNVAPQSAALTVETRGTSSTAQVATKIGETVGNQNGFISMVGPYQFNATGNTNVRGKYTTLVGGAVHSSHVSALAGKSAGAEADKAVSGYSLDPMTIGTTSIYVGGKSTGGAGNTGFPTIGGNNSSSAQLVSSNTGSNSSKIVKAYLVIACTQAVGFKGALTPLSKYGVSFIAPNADKVYRLYPEVVYRDGATSQRYSCFFDVTDIVTKQSNGGYGWYSVLNIPCTTMTNDNTTNTGTDFFASWRLAVVEENADLDPRMLRLKMGGVPVAPGGDAKVSIEGDGLSVKANPTGQLIASMDGTDCDSSNTQNISYTAITNTTTSATKIITNSATNRAKSDKYFRLRIDNRDLLNDATSFDPAPINASEASYSYLAAADNKKIHNTDLVVQDINDGKGGMELKGGENQVNMTVSTSDAPTILSVLGLTLDIVAPKFETTLKIANLNQHYATTDVDYKKDGNNRYIQTAQEGDQLRAVMVCQNVSEAEKTIGLKNPYVTFKVKSFKTINKDSIQGYFKPGYASDQNEGALDSPDTIALSKVEVTYDESEDCYLITCKPDKENEHITKRGYFEVSFTGEARSSKEYIEYTDEASVEGEFVDEKGAAHDDFHMARLGLTNTTTASDKEKYPLTITAVGPGKVAGTARYYNGDTARVSWQADENAHVVAVFEDSSVRDDLVAASQNKPDEAQAQADAATQADTDVRAADLANATDITMSNKGKEIIVVFESDPQDPDNPNDPQEEDTQEGTYSVKTIADGGVENISDSGTIDADSDYAVKWSVKPGYRVTSIQVDGVAIPFDETTQSIDFNKISANHMVKILTERVASDGSDGTWIVSTSISGPGTISSTKAVKAGESYKVEWSTSDTNAILSLVKVDGKVIYDEYLNNIKTDTENNAQRTKVEHEFTNIDTNHSVEVVYRGSSNTYSKDYVVDTKITGGLGDITPTVTVPEDSTSDVEITVTPHESSSVSAIYLGRGSVKQLLEDGKDGVKITKNATTGAWTVTLPHELIDSDYTVEAVMNMASDNPGDNPGGNQGKQYQITTSIAGGSGGKISASQINIAQGDSRTVTWQSDENNVVSAVMVDGNMRDDLLGAGKIDFANINADHSVVVYISKKDTDPGDNPGGDNPGDNPGGDKPVNPDNPNGHDPNKPDPTNPGNPGTPGNPGGIPGEDGDENYVYVNVVTIGAGAASSSVAAPLKGSAAVAWQADKGHEVTSITVDGIKRIDLMKMAQQGSLSFENLMRNHSVVITFSATNPNDPNNPTDPSNPDPRDNIDVTKPDTYSLITTKILGGAGTITGNTYNPAGATPVILWEPQEGYYVKSVYVDGKEIPLTEDMNEYQFDALEAGKHHSVEVRMAPVDPVDPTPETPEVVIDDEIDFPPMPGGKVTPDDILDVIEKTYGDDPNLPEGTSTVTITKDGKVVPEIDQSVPGVYVIEVVYTDDDGNQKVVRLTYTVKDSAHAGANTDNSTGTDNSNPGINKVKESHSARTADPMGNTMLLISGIAMGSLALIVFARRKTGRNN